MATTETPVSAESTVDDAARGDGDIIEYMSLPVKDIITKAGDNVRTGGLPDIDGMAASIKAQGVLQPILVTAALDTAGARIPGKFSIVAGHRRVTAVRHIGMTHIPARVINAEADRRITVALIENLQREDMNPLDKAKGVAKLLKTSGLEQQEVAKALGVASGYISQYLAILELPESALDMLRDGELSFTHARTLCKLLPDVKAIEDLLFDIPNLTVAALDAKVSHLAAKAKEAEPAVEAEADAAEGEAKPKKVRKAKVAPTEKEITYYEEADFHPKKKDEIRELMITYKRKEINADTATKREENRLILKGLTLAADLRFK